MRLVDAQLACGSDHLDSGKRWLPHHGAPWYWPALSSAHSYISYHMLTERIRLGCIAGGRGWMQGCDTEGGGGMGGHEGHT